MIETKQTPPVSLLNEYLHYDEFNGQFTWIKYAGPRAQVGSPAGHVHHTGYIRIKFKGAVYAASRLAYKVMMHEEAGESMDHINNVKTDNRWVNLRSVSQGENQLNRIDTKRNGGVTYKERRRATNAAQLDKRRKDLQRRIDAQRATNACKDE